MKKDDCGKLYLSKFEEALLLAYFIDALKKLSDSMIKESNKIFDKR